MGYITNYMVYKENVNKRDVRAELDALIQHESRGGMNGLPADIKWVEGIILDSKNEAETYLRDHCTGFYGQMAVRFKAVPARTKAMDEAQSKMSAARGKLHQRESAKYFANSKASFIGCKRCGSKLSIKHLKGNVCPLCWADLRPKSELDAISKLRQKVREMEERFKEVERSAAAKSDKLMWLVRYEFYC